MVEEISLAWELHKLVVEEQSKHLRPQLEKYPVYDWKVKLGAVAKPIVDFVELVIHFVPVLGQAVGALEAIAGKSILTGRKLEGWERLLGILPYAGTIWKAGKEGARAILVIARQTGLTPDAALRLIKNTSALSSDADRLREIKKIVDQGGHLSTEHQRTLKAAHDALKPFEGEAGIASTAIQRPSPAAGAIKQETKAIEVTAAPARPATPATAEGGPGHRGAGDQNGQAGRLLLRAWRAYLAHSQGWPHRSLFGAEMHIHIAAGGVRRSDSAPYAPYRCNDQTQETEG